MHRILSLLIFTALTASACGDSTPNTTIGTTVPPSTTVTSINLDDVVFASALIPFTACDDMLTYLQTEASSRVGAYGFNGDGYHGPIIMEAATMTRGEDSGDEATSGMVPDTAPATSKAGSDGLQEGTDYSGTNVQELGIDEPDLIKTDGTRILVVSGNELHYIDVSGSEAVITDSITLVGHWSSNILFAGDRAFVLAGTDNSETYEATAALSRLTGPDNYWKALTSVIEIDLSDPNNLAVANTLTMEGNYVSARVVNGVARVVVTTSMNQLPFVYPQSQAGEQNAKKFNQEIITSTVIEDWLPSYVLESSDGTISDGLLADCSNVHHPSEFAGFSTLNVLTVDLGTSLGSPSSTAVLADGQTVYAGGTNLYVATTSYIDPSLFENSDDTFWQELEENYATSIHQFDVSDPATTSYLASGSVEGSLLNQFSMSEHKGHLRVATTKGSPWGFNADSESMVTVLERDGAELKTVGQVGDMGAGERIYSVRFVGDVGYVVTFRQTDPFYTVDLSDPTNPVVRGELKITGYSGYLHPLGDGLVLGIGQEANDEGRTSGTKVTLFDARDLDNPVALDTWTTEGGNSSVEWDHRAFLWWGPENLAFLPFNDWSTSYSGAVALRIVDGTITEVGRIDHDDEPSETPAEPPCPLIDDGLLDFERPSWMDEEALTIMVCDGYDIDFDGQECEVVSSEEALMYGEEFGVPSDFELPEDSTLAICWPTSYDWMPTIERSLIIGDQLWTYSYERLQANDLATLDRQQVIKL